MKYWIFVLMALLVACQKAPVETPVETQAVVESPAETQSEVSTMPIEEILQRFFAGESIDAVLAEKADVQVLNQLRQGLVLSGFVKAEVVEEKEDEKQVEVILTDYRLLVDVQYQGDKILTMIPQLKPLVVEAQETDRFREREVKIGEHQISGMLTLPKQGERWPLVFIISGSGSSGMDGSIGKSGNALYREMAHALAEKGVATLRYNDRYYEFPELASQGITIHSEVLDDADWIAAHAKDWEGLAESPIFVIGHSLGGMLTPSMLERNPNLAGGISLAGSPRFLEDIIHMQNEDVVNAQNISEAEKQLAMTQVSMMIKAVKEIKSPDDPSNPMGIPASYWFTLTQESAPNRQNFTQPMLILQGGKDFQVKAEVDFEGWKQMYSERDDMSYQLFPELNHLFMPSQGIASIEDYNQKASLDAGVVDAIASWIKEVTP